MSQYGTDYGARGSATRSAAGAATSSATGAATATATRAVTGYGAGRGGAPVVSFENVSKQYGRLKAVDGLTLDLHTGETVALLGPNGAGKSTSLDMLLALRKPTGGH